MVAEAKLNYLKQIIAVWRDCGQEAQELVPLIERGVKAVAAQHPAGVRGAITGAGILDEELEPLVLRDALLSEEIS